MQKPIPASDEDSTPPQGKTVDVVILLHGIRTRAFWYDLVQPILSEIDGLVVKPLGYDYFSAFRLVFPFFRDSPAKKIADEIRAIRNRYYQQNQRVRLSVIAHSFGTYTIASVLRSTGDIDLHHVVLCGSVLPKNFEFDNISRKIHGRFVNDAGAKDVWPVVAKVASFGYGVSGTFGFQSGLVEDRFHDFAHSDFFNKEFIRSFWFPIFDRDQVVRSTFERKPSWRKSLINLLALVPSGALLVGLVAGAAYFSAPLAYDQYKRVHFSFVIDEIDKESTKPRQTASAPVVPPGAATQLVVSSDDDVIAKILKWEGGYFAGPGEVSNGGITLTQWSAYSGAQATADTIKNLTTTQMTAFYRDTFLQRPGVKEIANVAVKGAFVNMMVMSGQNATTLAFQSALNSSFQSNVPTDGLLGPFTVAAINAAKDSSLLIEAATCARLNAMKNRTGFELFGKAWTFRLRSFLSAPPRGLCPDLLK